MTPTQFVDELVAGPFDAPTNSSLLPDGRLFVVEQYTAQVRLIVDGQMSAIDPAGVVPGIRSGGEAGLLGVAVDPGFPARPYVYVQGTHLGALPGTNTVRIWRYTLTGDLAFQGDGAMALDPASQFVVLADGPDAAASHNGGTLRFGWPHYEGNHRLVTINCPAIDTTQFVPPVHEYPHVGAGWAVFAGPLYHAPAGRLVRL